MLHTMIRIIVLLMLTFLDKRKKRLYYSVVKAVCVRANNSPSLLVRIGITGQSTNWSEGRDTTTTTMDV